MKTRQQEREELLDKTNNLGYWLVVGLAGNIVFFFFVLIFLNVKGVKVF